MDANFIFAHVYIRTTLNYAHYTCQCNIKLKYGKFSKHV
jgi:hypothetical protein